ncbi:PhzF family phenazine biosynthesis protein [Parachlamydia acanthamoebae]|jgi:PhzF family phenazine biosynthesis protein|uniref:Uncharacterized isomerase yddE n=2 Tax=Parachlamydia acanthamoebae TaxID=83552 RepID=F8KZS8_PARAV|nr:PhzF family phenazine biosynthesis protein [Parachlamydia acanthamoebae]CCB86437.1 uncharacterized isomerase yddE [Parachlamydia acanthamoebae UV-7]
MTFKSHPIHYRLIDVFSKVPLAGNGLAVFMHNEPLNSELMQKLTQELRQYESIFLSGTHDPTRFQARIFTMEEELDFAGHPILGAACFLHELQNGEACAWTFDLPNKQVQVETVKKAGYYHATMEQGQPQFYPPLERSHTLEILKALNLSARDIHPNLPMQVISTGLPYLIVPVSCDLQKICIVSRNLAELLASVKAKFAYILQVSTLEGRTWDNDGRVEDIATGSAAGPVGAYLVQHGITAINNQFVINQGRFLKRPSQLFVQVSGQTNQIISVKVGGDVCMVARGVFDEIET